MKPLVAAIVLALSFPAIAHADEPIPLTRVSEVRRGPGDQYHAITKTTIFAKVAEGATVQMESRAPRALDLRDIHGATRQATISFHQGELMITVVPNPRIHRAPIDGASVIAALRHLGFEPGGAPYHVVDTSVYVRGGDGLLDHPRTVSQIPPPPQVEGPPTPAQAAKPRIPAQPTKPPIPAQAAKPRTPARATFPVLARRPPPSR